MNHVTEAQSGGKPLFPGDRGAGRLAPPKLSPVEEYRENIVLIAANGKRRVNTIITEGIKALRKSS